MGVGWSRFYHGPLPGTPGCDWICIGGALRGYPGDSATLVDRQFGVVLYDEDVTICSNTQLLLLI